MPQAPLPVLDLCLKEALELSRAWVPAWLDRVHSLLREREQVEPRAHERQALAEAYQTVQRQRDAVARHWLSALADRLAQGPEELADQARKPALSLDELELMGDDQVHERVESARVQQAALMVAEDAFQEFTARLSTAQGFKVVNPELNPLRAAVFIETLSTALTALHVTPSARARWLKVGAQPLGEALGHFYRRLNGWLGEQGVRPAGYQVVTAPESRVLPEELLQGMDLSGNAMSDQEALLTLDHLHRLLVGNGEAGNAGAIDEDMTRALAAEVVTLMMQRIAADKRLLKPLRNHLQEMKPALLELAASDPRFFADRHNPARRLLDAVTARSLAFTSERDEGYSGFLQQLRHVVYELRRPSSRTLSERFPSLLDELRESEDRAVPRGEREARGRAVQTLVRVEQRKLLAEKIAAEFRERPDYAKSPGPVRRFLTSVWAQVVAKARIDEADHPPMTSGDTKSQRYVDLLTDLLWSSQLAQASLNRPRLVRVIPPVLRTLREGLDGIDYPRERVDAFFQTLMGLHEAAYKTQRPEAAAPAVSAAAAALEDLSVFNADDGDHWMRRQEARDTNFYDDAIPESTQPGFQATQPQESDWQAVAPERVLRDAGSLNVGSWFDLQQEGQALRVQLTWASPHATLFLFGTASGKSMSMTRRGVDRLIEQDKLRVVADHSVVEEALDAVAQQALKNSGKG